MLELQTIGQLVFSLSIQCKAMMNSLQEILLWIGHVIYCTDKNWQWQTSWILPYLYLALHIKLYTKFECLSMNAYTWKLHTSKHLAKISMLKSKWSWQENLIVHCTKLIYWLLFFRVKNSFYLASWFLYYECMRLFNATLRIYWYQLFYPWWS